jgi:hypothetical protein
MPLTVKDGERIAATVRKFSWDSLSRVTKRYWEPYEVDGILCALSNDGLLFMFHKDDVAVQLHQYPFKDGAWWFNDSFDRHIAERCDFDHDLITANPQFVYQNFET